MDIIKKIAAIILAAALCLGGAALAEETPGVTPEDFMGEWVDLDGTCNIDITEHTDGEIIDGYVVNVHMPVIAEESYSYVAWAYGCVWDHETQTLKSISRVTGKGDYEPDSEEEITDSNLDYTAAAFSFDEEGRLAWNDENESADDGLRFVRPIGWGDGMRFEKLPEEPAVLSFATIGEAMASEGFTGVIGGDDQHYVVAMEKDGAYIRLVADLDDEARRLGEATLEYVDADTLEAAFNAYNEYVKTLPVAYEEKITAQPLTQEELDALAGKTLQELEDAGYEHVSSEMGENDEATYTVSFGLYEYNLLLNETYTVYQQHDDSGFIGDLTVKSAAFAGLSRNAAELRYHADGTYDAEKDGWAEFNGIMDLISQAMSGENPEEAIQKLIEAMPEHAEEIRTFAEIFSSISDQNQK